MNGYECILGDCLEVMAGMEAESVDAVLTDPPYGCQDKNQVQAHGVNSGTGKVVDFKLSWNFDLPLEYLAQCARLLKPGGSLVTFTDTKRVETVWNHVEALGLRPLQLFYWMKSNPPPQPRKNFQSGVETAIFARKPGKVIFWGGGGALPNYIQSAIAMGGDRTPHPTQKHVAPMQVLIGAIAPPGGVVLDPFGGSGTTGVAGLLTGRHTILIEKDPEYFKIMEERLAHWQASDVVRQMDLFGKGRS